jgi:ribosomal protein S12 methylthiotransferase
VDRAATEDLLHRLRAKWPDLAIRTTFIAGFPGETDAEFEELQSFVRDAVFDHVGVFTYSHEEGTRAFDRADDVTPAVKRRRRAAVMAQQQDIVARVQRDRVGTRVVVMVDGRSPQHELVLQGRLEGQAPEIDPVVYLTDADAGSIRPGDLVVAEIVDARGYDVLARPVI